MRDSLLTPIRTLSFVALSLVGAGSVSAGSLTLIPVPAGAQVYMTDVSGNGRVVVGSTGAANFYWTSELGVVYIPGIAPGSQGVGGVVSVSDSGSLVSVGDLDANLRAQAAGYNIDAVSLQLAPGLGGNCDITGTSAWNISGNGQAIVGLGYQTFCGTPKAFVWPIGSATMTALPSYLGLSARANGVNFDATTVVGWASLSGSDRRAAFWKFSGSTSTWTRTQVPPPGAAGSMIGEAQSCSADGQAVVGFATISGLQQVFRWTQATGTVALPAPMTPALPGYATGCSGDGTKVLAFFRAGPPPTSGEGYLWVQGRGYVELESYAAEYGVAVPPGIRLSLPLAISADGFTIVGTGRDDVAGGTTTFVLDLHSAVIPCPADLNGDRVVNGADLGILLGAWGVCSSSPCTGDLNGDGVVSGADLGILLGAWGACP